MSRAVPPALGVKTGADRASVTKENDYAGRSHFVHKTLIVGSVVYFKPMQKKLQEVVELARRLPLAQRVAVARELLAPSDEAEFSEHELRELEGEIDRRDNLMPYEEVRRELGLGAHSKSTKAAR